MCPQRPRAEMLMPSLADMISHEKDLACLYHEGIVQLPFADILSPVKQGHMRLTSAIEPDLETDAAERLCKLDMQHPELLLSLLATEHDMFRRRVVGHQAVEDQGERLKMNILNGLAH